MNSNKPINRNTASIIAKCLIVCIVLGIVCSLSIWAWLTKGTSATADGISVKSKGDGVQVSWNGKDYYDNLQALKAEDVSASGGASGPALNISGVEGQPAPLKLVTGNGLQFFEPSINRRLGKVLTNADGSWHGNDIASSNSEGKFIDIDLYFRSDVERDVYLAGDSAVSPKSTTDRMSAYGAFSKDYIAAASRIAFLDSTKNNCSFIWAPNLNCRLESNESGYQKYTTTAEEEIKTTVSGSLELDNFTCDNDGKTYYFWTFRDDKVITSYPDDLSDFKARQFVYDEELKFFVADVSLYIPTYGGDNPSIPIFINETPTANLVNIDSYDQYIKGAESRDTYEQYDKGQYFGVTNSDFNIGDYTSSNAMDIANGAIKTNSKVDFKVAYNPQLKHLVVLSYTAPEGSFVRGGEDTEEIINVTYFPLGDNVNCVLVNPSSSTAVSSGTNYKNSVIFTDSNKNNASPVSTTLTEQFTTVKNTKNGTGYKATFKFKNNSTNTYLTLTNGAVSYTAAGSEFTLEYKDGVQGPLLKAGDYYLVIEQGRIMGVKSDALNTDNTFTVYVGNTYALYTEDTQDQQPYQFYNNTSKKLETLDHNSTPKLFTSSMATSADVKVGNTKIATLSKEDGDEYYTAHIVMRVWVEGTDREAKTPLADGIFDISLHFTSQ